MPRGEQEICKLGSVLLLVCPENWIQASSPPDPGRPSAGKLREKLARSDSIVSRLGKPFSTIDVLAPLSKALATSAIMSCVRSCFLIEASTFSLEVCVELY